MPGDEERDNESDDIRRFDVVTVGESLGLLTVERPGRLHNGAATRLGFGGAESNVAIGIARLGGRAAWIGRLGADAIGELIVRELRAENVAPYAVHDADHATSLMLKQHPQPRTSHITYYRRDQAGSHLNPADLPPDVIESASILHVTGISAALGEQPRATIHAAIDRARAAGTLVSFDVNHRQTLWRDPGEAAPAYRDLLSRADIVFAGEGEAELVTGESEPGAALGGLLGFGAQCAVLKRGANGAIAGSADGRFESASALTVPVVDTVGAGDAFVAGWLVAAARSSPLSSCLQTAISCGAWACTNDGDWEGAPTSDDLVRLADVGADPVTR